MITAMLNREGWKVNHKRVERMWGEIFADSILDSAITDRIVHYSTIINIKRPNYRRKDLKGKGGDEG